MNMIEGFIEKKNKSLKEIHKNTIKYIKEMNKIKELKMEIERIKKHKLRENWRL